MKNRLCIAIAVSKPEGLDEIPGAIPSAVRVAQWAHSQGYEVRLVTDKRRPVTCDRLAKIFHARLRAGGQQRVIVSFAGHGLIRGGAEEYWLLNGWRTRPTEAVNYLKLRDRLGTYRPKQLAVISDACRSLPTDRAKWVEGNGVVDVKDYVEIPVQVAQLTGTRSAQPAYATPLGAEEAYCFFTQVLVNALEGTPPEVIEFDRDGKRLVQNDPLFAAVEKELPLLASRYQRRQVPDLQGSWRSPANVWSILPEDTVPSPPAIFAPAGRQEAVYRGDAKTDREEQTKQSVRQMLKRFSSEERPYDFATGTGMAFSGASVEEIVTSPNARIERDERNPRWFAMRLKKSDAAPVLAKLGDGSWVGAAGYGGFIGTFGVGEDGAQSFVLRPTYSDSRSTEEAVARAAMGDDLADPFELAAMLRDNKHADPVLGALASYVYARAGAVDEIRRLCFFYARRRQPVPFDAVLLARLPIERKRGKWIAEIPAVGARPPRNEAESKRGFTHHETPRARAQVGGNFPWLRQGWALLEDDFRPAFRRLAPFAKGIHPSLFTTFTPDIGDDFAAAIRKGEF